MTADDSRIQASRMVGPSSMVIAPGWIDSGRRWALGHAWRRQFLIVNGGGVAIVSGGGVAQPSQGVLKRCG